MEFYYEEPANFDFDTYQVYQNAAAVSGSFKTELIFDDTLYKRRPGRLPARPDEELNEIEYERRQRRRDRNRHAAARCRSRRIQRVGYLEGQVHKLSESKLKLLQVNQGLRREFEQLKIQLTMQQPTVSNCLKLKYGRDNKPFPALKNLENLRVGQSCTVSFTPLLRDLSFEFPTLPSFAVDKIRNQSLTEFNKILCLV